MDRKRLIRTAVPARFPLSLLYLLLPLLAACSGIPAGIGCPDTAASSPAYPPPGAVSDPFIDRLYAMRTWRPPSALKVDPVRFGEQANIPINQAYARTLGPALEDAQRSLAVKLWLIEHARHTVDVMYYIFKRDRVGYAVIGALCEAVRRGVDIRIMVDSLGSLHPTHSELRALETCANQAGWMRNAEGRITNHRARVQVVIFNSLWKLQFNRRSHDKLLVVDGSFPEHAAVMTGGRNISLDYYGITPDGHPDPATFRDLEILLRANPDSPIEKTVGFVTERYYTLLFLHRGNRRLWPVADDEDETLSQDTYAEERRKASASLAFFHELPLLRSRFATMPDYLDRRTGFHPTQVRLSHQLSNLDAYNVTTRTEALIARNPNSILHLIDKLTRESLETGRHDRKLMIVSPYLFVDVYYDEAGNLVYDGARLVREQAHRLPDASLAVITNSVLTSDNFLTQSLIDMAMIPRVLLPPDLMKAWRSGLADGEFNPAVVQSPEWIRSVNDPQIRIYQTGRADDVLLGGNRHYGKLHAKFIVGDHGGFIGTSNFDYRSNLYNNEMGFFFRGQGLRDELVAHFEWLRRTSTRWGSPEWLAMRRKLMASDTFKGSTTRKQRIIARILEGLGLEYLL